MIKAKALTPSGKLPPVLPLVLYNRVQRWYAAQDVAELVEVVPLGDWSVIGPSCSICCWMKAGLRSRN